MKFSERDLSEFNKINTDTWDGIKENVCCRLINAKYLSKYGENIAHTKFLDLACTFSLVEKGEDTFITHMLTNEELETYDISQVECMQTAKDNTARNRKKRILPLSESIMSDSLMYPLTRIPKNAQMGCSVGNGNQTMGIISDRDEEGNENILVILNKNMPFGASNLMNFDALEEVYERFNENFYILPMSVHQVWCVKYSYAVKDGEKPIDEAEDDLLDMVEEFNDTQNKSWEDILSYKMYYYAGDDGKVLIPLS